MISYKFLSNLFFVFCLTNAVTLTVKSQDCNDLKTENVKIIVRSGSTSVQIDRQRVQVLPLLDFADEAEVRYRELGNSNWINASGNYSYFTVPFLPFPPTVIYVFDADFNLNTEFGGIRYEMQSRIHCSVSGWGPWLTKNFNSYCGSDDLENQPSDIDAEQLIYQDPHAEEGRLSEDEGRSFFKIKNYQNQELKFQDLKPNTSYWFKCRALCDNGDWTSFTPLVRVKTHCNKPNLNDIHIYSENMGTRFGISCTRSASRYEFRMRRKGNSNWTGSGMINTDSYSFPTNVNKGDIYEFQCRIECGGQWTEYSDIEEYSIPVECPQPSGDLGVNQISESGARFYCHSGHGSGVTEGHHFRYRESSGSNWTEKFTNSNEIDINRLNSNTEYVMQVQHECTNNVTGNWSVMEFFTTDASCNINSSKVTVQDITYSSALLKCTQSNRDGYTWDLIRVRDGKSVKIPNQLTQNTYLADSLSAGEEYQLRLKVFCGTESSEFTEPIYFNTLYCADPVENNISIQNIENTAAHFIYSGNIQSGLEWQYRQIGNTNWRKVNSNQNDTRIESLVRNADYEYRMRILCSSQPSIYSNWSSIKTFSTDCSAKILRFSGINANSITAHCSDIGADSYEFRYRKYGTSNWTHSPLDILTYFKASNLQEDTEYEFQCRSKCNSQFSNWSESESASTLQDLNDPCIKVFRIEMHADQIGTSSAELSCSRASADGFVFRIKSVNESSWKESSLLSNGVFPVSGLTPATIYQFQCRVKCGNDLSVWSDTARFRTLGQIFGLATSCPAPYLSELLAANIGFQNANLFCIRDADHYQFRYRELNSNPWTELPEISENRILVSGLSAGSTYEFQCRNKCNDAEGIYSESQNFTTPTLGLCEPINENALYEFGLNASGVRIIIGIQSKLYQIRYKKLTSDQWTHSDTSLLPLFRLTELEPNQEYAYQVRMWCPNGQISNFSNVRNFKTLDACLALPANLLRVDSVTSNAAILSHSDQTLKETYLFRYRIKGSAEWKIKPSHNILKRFVLLDSLIPETEYEFQILVVCNSASISGWSDSKFFKTSAATLINQSTRQFFRIFPNPAERDVIIQCPKCIQEEVIISVFDLSGRICYQTKYSEIEEFKFQLNLFPGVYQVSLQSSKVIYRQNLIIN